MASESDVPLFLAGPATPSTSESRQRGQRQSVRTSSLPELNTMLHQNRAVSPPTPAASPTQEDAQKFASFKHFQTESDTPPWGSSGKQHRRSFSRRTTCSELPATPPHQVDPYSLIQDTTSNFASLNSAERRLFLEALLPVLSNADRLHLSTLLQPMLKRDFLKDLPPELGLHVLSFCEDPKDLVHASSVSKAWRTLVLDEATWKQLFEKHRFGGGPKTTLLLPTTKLSRHPGVLPLAQDAAPGGSNAAAAQPQRSRRVTAPPSRLPGPQNSTSPHSSTRTGPDNWSLQGLGIRRQSTSAQSPTQRPPATSQSPAAAFTPSTSAPFFTSIEAQSDTPETAPVEMPPAAPHIVPDNSANLSQHESYVGPFRPTLIGTRGESSATSDSNASSSHASLVTDPWDPHQVGAAAARMDMPLLSEEAAGQQNDRDVNGSSTPSDARRRTSSLEEGTSPPPLPRSFSSHNASSPRLRPNLSRAGASNPRAFSQSVLNFPNLQEVAASSSGPGRAVASPVPNVSTNPFGQAEIYPNPSRQTSGNSIHTTATSASTSSLAPETSFDGSSFGSGRKHFSYQSEFKRAYLTESNWMRGPGRILSSQAAGEEGIVTCLCFDSDWIIVGMAKKEIHVFDARNGQYVRTLAGHQLGVWAIALVSQGGFRVQRPTTPEDAAAKGETSAPGASSPSRTSAPSGFMSPSRSFQDQSQASASTSTNSTSAADGGVDVDSRPSFPNRPSSYGSAQEFAQATGRSVPGSSTSKNGAPSTSSNDPALGSVCGTSLGWGQASALAVSGSCDRHVRVWDVNTGECLHVLQGHRSTVRCLKVLDHRPIAVSGSRDATLRVWNIEKGHQVHVLRGHTDHVRCLEVFGNRAVSGSYDNSCRLWDIDTGQCLFVYAGHFAQIYAVAFDGQRIATGSLDSTVRIWSAETGDCLALLQGHTTLVGQLQLRDSVLVTGGSDGRVIVFSLSTLECLHRLCAHDNSVTCMQFDDRFLVTGGNDGRVKLFDFKSGQFIRELAEPCEAVWRITFRDDKIVIMCRRQGRTTMSLLTFRPDEAEL